MFVRSLRNGNFEMFVKVLDQFLPWMFSINHTHYARWLNVYTQTLKNYLINIQKFMKSLKKGQFTVQKTQRIFCRISDDHAHEPNNKVIKGNSGATEIPAVPKKTSHNFKPV